MGKDNFQKLSLLFGLAIVASFGCSAPKSTTIPDYAATRVKVNTGTSQSASLEARTAVVEIKNSKEELDGFSAQLGTLKEEIEASRMKLAK